MGKRQRVQQNWHGECTQALLITEGKEKKSVILAVKRWTELLEAELPNGVDLHHVGKFCSTTRSLYIKTNEWLDRTREPRMKSNQYRVKSFEP